MVAVTSAGGLERSAAPPGGSLTDPARLSRPDKLKGSAAAPEADALDVKTSLLI